MIVIYKITSPSNKIYIGQAVNYNKRLISYKGLHCKKQIKLYNSLKKYGYNNHKFEIIEECNFENLNIRERYWQDYYDVIGKNGLNLKLTKTEELKEKVSDETRKKLSNSKLGCLHTQETKNKISKANTGLKRSKEVLLKLSKSHSKAVIDTSTNITYNSAKIAAIELKYNYVTLVAKLNGRKRNNTTLKYNSKK